MSGSNTEDILKPMRLSARFCCALFLCLAFGLAQAQIVVPTFGSRGAVPELLVTNFMRQLRIEVARQTDLNVTTGELITAGIASSLEPEFTYIIAELDEARYALSGEISTATAAGVAPYAVNILMVDSETERASDIVSLPLSETTVVETAAQLALTIRLFIEPEAQLPVGSAGLFISSEPAEAQVFIDDVPVGLTSRLDVLMLAPGFYELELRKEGFLPLTRVIELKEGLTEFVPVTLTANAGGSIQISSAPRAQVIYDGEAVGSTPLTLSALPGEHVVQLERPGFTPETISVTVKSFRVTRLTAALEPEHALILYWDLEPGQIISINAAPQQESFSADLGPGRHLVEIRQGQRTQSFNIFMPRSGAYRLDTDARRVVPLDN